MADEAVEELEERISELRAEARRANADGDTERYAVLRKRLRRLQELWEEAIEDEAPVKSSATPVTSAGPMLPVREQVFQILTLLRRPAAPKLIVAVHEAFFSGELAGTQLTYLRRDEERSFQSAPNTRPYYLCSALSMQGLNAVRGLLAVSTWPLDHRIIGPLSPRVDLLIGTISVAQHIERTGDPGPAARRLLWRLASGIPDAAGTLGDAKPQVVIRAAQDELAVHEEADRHQRLAGAERGRKLDPVQQLFGAPIMGSVSNITAR